jgi:hypothetical protein
MSVAPSFFSGCSFAQPSGLAPLPTTALAYVPTLPKNRTDSDTIPFSFAVVARYALNQGTPRRKSGADYIVNPPFHAHIRFVSLRTSAVLPRLWWQFDCRNPATALLIRKKSSLPRKRGTTFFAPCGAWGCLIAVSIRTFATILRSILLKKNKKNKVKVSSGFKK